MIDNIKQFLETNYPSFPTDKAILFFDMDGVLVNTNKTNLLAYQKAIYDVLGEKLITPLLGGKRFTQKSLRQIFPNLPEEIYRQIIKLKQYYYVEYIDTVIPNQNIVNILRYQATKTNNTIVLTTNSERNRALATLNHFELTPLFNHLFFKELYDPQQVNKFATAISTLKISPQHIIIFEDEEAEIIKAKEAGIQVINPFLIKE